MVADDLDSEVRDVYAHFGLATYMGQVLEHGLANALMLTRLIPAHSLQPPTSVEQWQELIDGFMDTRFERSMGQLLGELRDVSEVPAELDTKLRAALTLRNWLVHNYFRERVEEFMAQSGRLSMIDELVRCRDQLKAADAMLEDHLAPIRESYGLTDEAMAAELERMREEMTRPR